MMTKEQLLKKGCLVPEQVVDACRTYQEETITGTDHELRNFLYNRVAENGAEHTFFDFYYGVLREEEKQRVRAVLTSEEQEILDNREFSSDRENVYFPYDEELFPIALKLSLNGDLFSTFYFAGTKETVWTNYEHQFLIFRRQNENS